MLSAVSLLGMPPASALAQRIQFPTPYQAPPRFAPNPYAAAPGPYAGAPGSYAGAPGFGAAAPSGANLGGNIQPFDPYALPGNFSPAAGLGGQGRFPVVPPGSLPPGTLPPGVVPPPGLVRGNQAAGGYSGVAPNLPPLSADPYGTATTPPGGFGNSPRGNAGPNALGGGYQPDLNAPNPFANPNSASTGTGFSDWWNSRFGRTYDSQGQSTDPAYGAADGGNVGYQRLFQDVALRGTYLYGSKKDDLSLTEAEASASIYYANFLGVPNGLRITPGFAFHWTDGPQPPETSDIPARLYSAYLDFGLKPQFSPRFSAELSARVGVYSDFQKFNGDSLRILGTGVGVWQATPTVALKLGAAYIDRVNIKFLPAGGILWTPNDQTRWDVFFPAPKLSNYWGSVGDQQVWWYVGGEYGGGSWTIEREDRPPDDDRIDINDLRIFAGVEWWNSTRYYGFAEVGYVFDREVLFYKVPGDTLKVDDAFMVRAGISW